MTLVGTRPESTHYVKKYTPEMYATLLLPAGVTSEASIKYKDEAELLDKADDVDKVYVEKVLPEKMKYNLESIRKFSFIHDMADITGVRASNIARFERASCMPTLIMLEKYANALGKHIEISICEDEE